MSEVRRALTILWIVGIVMCTVVPPAFAQEEAPASRVSGATAGLLGLAAALALAFGALGTAWAQSRIGSAAAGAMAERPEIGGLMLVFLALPETMIILGFLVAFFILGKI